jgi:hypothetical protein
MNPEQKEALISGAKLTSVWAAVGFTTWADVAAFLAALYSVLLIGEFVWKKWAKPLALWWAGRVK